MGVSPAKSGILPDYLANPDIASSGAQPSPYSERSATTEGGTVQRSTSNIQRKRSIPDLDVLRSTFGVFLSCNERGAYQAQLLLALFLCLATSAMLPIASAVQPV